MSVTNSNSLSSFCEGAAPPLSPLSSQGRKRDSTVVKRTLVVRKIQRNLPLELHKGLFHKKEIEGTPNLSMQKLRSIIAEGKLKFPRLHNLIQLYLREVASELSADFNKESESRNVVVDEECWRVFYQTITSNLHLAGSPRFKSIFSKNSSLSPRQIALIERFALQKVQRVEKLIDFLEDKKLSRADIGDLPWHRFQVVIRSPKERELFLDALESQGEITPFLENVLSRKGEGGRYLLSREGIYNALLLTGIIDDGESVPSPKKETFSPKSGDSITRRVGHIANQTILSVSERESLVSFTLYDIGDNRVNCSITSPRDRAIRSCRVFPFHFSCQLPTTLIEKFFTAMEREAKGYYYRRVKMAVLSIPSPCDHYLKLPETFRFFVEGNGAIQAYIYDPDEQCFTKLGDPITERGSGSCIEELEKLSIQQHAEKLVAKLAKEESSIAIRLVAEMGLPLLEVTYSSEVVKLPLYRMIREDGVWRRKEWQELYTKLKCQLVEIAAILSAVSNLKSECSLIFEYSPNESHIFFLISSHKKVTIELSSIRDGERLYEKKQILEKLQMIALGELLIDLLKEQNGSLLGRYSFDHKALSLTLYKGSKREKFVSLFDFLAESYKRSAPLALLCENLQRYIHEKSVVCHNEKMEGIIDASLSSVDERGRESSSSGRDGVSRQRQLQRQRGDRGLSMQKM